MSGTARGVGRRIITIAISRDNGHVLFADPLLRTKSRISFGVFLSGIGILFFLKEKHNNFYGGKLNL
jgi:hypothetical protein